MPKLTQGGLEIHEGPRKGLNAVTQLGNDSTPPLPTLLLSQSTCYPHKHNLDTRPLGIRWEESSKKQFEALSQVLEKAI